MRQSPEVKPGDSGKRSRVGAGHGEVTQRSGLPNLFFLTFIQKKL